MIAELYILEESFALNKELSALEIEEKTKRLAEDFKIITKHGEDNKLFVDFSVLKGVQFYSNYTIGDFLFNPMEMKKFIDRDVVNSIQTIFQKAQHTNISSTEVINVLLPWHDKDRCHGLIAFKKLNGIDENVQVIYGIDGFFKFRRYFWECTLMLKFF